MGARLAKMLSLRFHTYNSHDKSGKARSIDNNITKLIPPLPGNASGFL